MSLGRFRLYLYCSLSLGMLLVGAGLLRNHSTSPSTQTMPEANRVVTLASSSMAAPSVSSPPSSLKPVSLPSALPKNAPDPVDFAAQFRRLIASASGSQRDNQLMRLVAAWAASSPQDAAAAMLALPADQQRDRLLGQVVAVWSRQNPQSAIDWLQANEPAHGAFALQSGQIYAAWAGSDPAAAAQYALNHGAGTESIQAILANWTRSQPSDACNFFSTQLSENQRAQVAGSFLLAAAGKDPDVTQKLVDYVAQTFGDSAQTWQLAGNLARLSPDTAAALAAKFPDSDQKNQFLQLLASRQALNPVGGTSQSSGQSASSTAR